MQYVAALPTIGNVVRDARRRAGLTQAELADRLNTTQSAIARLESPRSNPRLQTALRVLAATGQEVELTLRPARSPAVDESLIAENLKLTASERLRRFAAAYRSLSRLAGKAEPVGP